MRGYNQRYDCPRMKILNAEQMRNIDRRATERFGIPSIVLMENAAHRGRRRDLRALPRLRSRGDLLRHRRERRRRVRRRAASRESRRRAGGRDRRRPQRRSTATPLTNLAICERLGIPIYDDHRRRRRRRRRSCTPPDADVVVDAIFGTGLNRAPDGHLRGGDPRHRRAARCRSSPSICRAARTRRRASRSSRACRPR